jgi:ATP-binding cassette subfamily C protein
MDDAGQQYGGPELRAGSGGLIALVALFSVAVNLLLLTGPLYMLQVYDRVLASRSVPTLVALSLLAAGLFAGLGVLDLARGRILARIGARLQDRLDRRVFTAAHRRLVAVPADPSALAALRDLEAVQRLWSSPLMVAAFDLPWAPLFLAAIFAFGAPLGWLALGGGGALVALALLNQRLTEPILRRSGNHALAAERRATDLATDSETILALGMAGSTFARWAALRRRALDETVATSDRGGLFNAMTRTLRMALQSAALGLGAWLVLQDRLSGGAMVASSILLGRTLQPVEQIIAQWPVLTRAAEGRRRLAFLLSRHPPETLPTPLPRPAARLEVLNLTVIPPGQGVAVLRGISFALEPGQALGVIGPSGAGKTSLARALTGLWPAAVGTIRLDGATPGQFGAGALGRLTGYLPQQVTLFDGTVAENIARLDPAPEPAALTGAARRAAAHALILQLPQGYDTPVSGLGGRLSGGQMQRVGLARALYGNPVLLILDEPNASLDHEGTEALNAAVRAHKAAGGAVLIMAHRPAALQECDLLLMLEDGRQRAFGPRDQVLREVVRNQMALQPATAAGARGAT